MNKISILLLFFLLCLNATLQADVHRIVIPDTDYSIAYPEGEDLQYAAAFLSDYLERITGQRPEILRESEAADASPSIYLGATKFAASRIGDLTMLEAEELMVQNFAADIVICGEVYKDQIDRGTLFGVYEFLESVMGVRWYFADDRFTRYPAGLGTVIPEKSLLDALAAAGNINIRSYPVNINRIGGLSHYSWAPEISRQWHPVLRFGSSREWREPNHSQVGWTDLYTDSHPEYFAVTATGRRLINHNHKHRSYICLSNPEVLEQMLQNIEQYDLDQSTASAFRPLPSEQYVYFGPNDGQKPGTTCHCDDCIKYHRPERDFAGYGSELVYQFVKRYAEAINERWPGRRLVTFGYSHYREPPEEIEIPDNVNVVYVVSGFYYGEKEIYETEMQRLRGWHEKLGGDRTRLSLWMNIVSPSRYDSDVPFMYPDVLQRFLFDTREYASGYFINGLNQYLRRIGPRALHIAVQTFPMVWIQSRLLWNPHLDADELLQQYCRDMFGPGSAAATMYDFYKLVQNRWEHLHRGSLKMSQIEFIHQVRYPPDVMAEFMKLLDRAYDETTAETMARTRVAYFRDNVYNHFINENKRFARFSNNLPSYNVLPVPAEFYSDGILDESVWNSIPYLALTQRQWGEDSDRKTEIRCIHDGEYMYLNAKLSPAPDGNNAGNDEIRVHFDRSMGVPTEPHALNINREWPWFREVILAPKGVISHGFDAAAIESEFENKAEFTTVNAKIPLRTIIDKATDSPSARVQFIRYWGVWDRWDTWSPMLSHISDYAAARFGVLHIIEGDFQVEETGLE